MTGALRVLRTDIVRAVSDAIAEVVEKLAPAQGQIHHFQPEDELLRFLAGL